MNPYAVILLLLISAWVTYKFQKDISAGVHWVLGLLVFLPTWIKIETGIAYLNVHRILILIAFVFLIRYRTPDCKPRPIPNLGLLLLFGLSQLVSVLLGTEFASGLKGITSYGIEVVLFYVIMSRFVQAETSIVPLLTSFCYGLGAVAVLAAVEKYRGVNMLGNIVPPSQVHPEQSNMITSTYSHRIMLGYAMVMGAALALPLSIFREGARPRRVMFAILLLLVAAAYFSTSRGPWLGLAIAVLGLAALGGPSLRRKLLVTALLAAAVLIWRPGVRESISDRMLSTFVEDSVEADSYQTRWQLWDIAWTEIQKSPERLLFGYGPMSTEHMNLEHYFYGQEGWSSSVQALGYTSWDNNLACDLIELGVVGLALELALFATIMAQLLANYRVSLPQQRILPAGIIVACLVFMFATTNVFIFSPQLKFLFWALVAIGSNRAEPEPAAALAEAAADLDQEPQPTPAESPSAAHVTSARSSLIPCRCPQPTEARLAHRLIC